MNKVTVSIHTGCIGTEREGKPIMLSLDGMVEGNYQFLDSFLTIEEANELILKLSKAIKKTNKGEK